MKKLSYLKISTHKFAICLSDSIYKRMETRDEMFKASKLNVHFSVNLDTFRWNLFIALLMSS